MYSFDFRAFSIGWGATILPPEVLITSFFRSVIDRNPSPSSSPMSPGATGELSETVRFLRQAAGRFGIAVESFSTALPVGQALGEFFHLRRTRRSRAIR